MGACQRVLLAALVGIVCAVAGCAVNVSEDPAWYPYASQRQRLWAETLETLEVRVTDQLKNDTPVKLDFLWVIDHSPSMCQEQRQLAKGFKELTKVLNSFGEGAIDAQMAVVTVQQAPDKADVRVVGRFKHDPATAFPPNCYERIRTNCVNDEQCNKPTTPNFPEPTDSTLCGTSTLIDKTATLSAGKWKCKGPKTDDGTIKVSKLSNLNCSLNTYCEASCSKGDSGDKFCGNLFEPNKATQDRTVQCSVPGGGEGVGGCIFQPDTASCDKPFDLPGVISQKDLEKFACIATVGAAQTQESKFEGGFRSAWTALDPDGPNCKYQTCVDSLRTCCTEGAPYWDCRRKVPSCCQGPSDKECTATPKDTSKCNADLAKAQCDRLSRWCTETNPVIIKQNKLKCEIDKVEQCEYLTPYGACKRKIDTCCLGAHDEVCSKDRDKKKCDAAVKSQCDKFEGKTDVVEDACQNTRLLRPDGYLVLVFVSDDDDCSMHLDIHPHDSTSITKEIWEKCQIHNDSLIGNRDLAEGHCEYRRGKSEAMGTAMYCPSDCIAGSTTKTSDGLLKCANGCKPESSQQLACLAKATAQMEVFDKEKLGYYKYKNDPNSAFKEQLAGWQFAPVGEFVNRFKSLKDDPTKVIVAAIVGDSMHEDAKAVTDAKVASAVDLQQHRDRVNFYRSMKVDVGPGQAPYICLGERGEASYGSRYVQLAEAFRDNGVTFNICSGSDFGPALRGIAEQILKRVVKLCLPAPPETSDDGVLLLKVTHKRDGNVTELERADADDKSGVLRYRVEASPDCRAGKVGLPGDGASCKALLDCTSGLHCKKDGCVGQECEDVVGRCVPYTDAIFFTQTLDELDLIEVNYKVGL